MAAILVVEDERIVACDIEESLLALGYDVVGTAASADECWNAVARRRPDLVLMDVRIQGDVDGIETARRLRANYDIPVVYLTAYADERSIERACETSPHGYVLKPFRSGELRSAVEVALVKHRLETELKHRERWFSTTLDAIGDAVIAADRDGIVTLANPMACAILGKPREELVGASLRRVYRTLDERTRESLEDPSLDTARRDRNLRPPDRTALVTAGGEVPIEESVAPILEENGEVLGVVVVFRDATEARRHKERVALVDRLNSLGTLAAGVAHEINNPLTYVMGNAAVIQQRLDALRRVLELGVAPPGVISGSLEGNLREMATGMVEIQDGAMRIRKIVNDLKIFSHPNPGPEEFGDPLSAVKWALRVTDTLVRQRARLETVLEPVPRVPCDDVRLGQVFLNLIMNAAQAIPDGEPASHVIAVKVGVEPDGRVSVTVRDTGSGMTPDVQRRIFEPFFTTKPFGSGTGLGLSITHGIVRSTGGEIRVQTEPGTGSTFRVILPPAKTETSRTGASAGWVGRAS
jgi:two-component system, cell cycle sensor histidine kinase and response regulator CckA